jgi:hypothetical protein
MAAVKPKKEDLVPRWNYVPERLRRIYWHGPLFMYGFGICLWASWVFWGAWHPFPLVFQILLCVSYAWAAYFFYRKRKKILEIETLKGLSKGWHLIYRRNFFAKHYFPELIFESDFKKLLRQRVAWWKINVPSVKFSEIDRARLNTKQPK